MIQQLLEQYGYYLVAGAIVVYYAYTYASKKYFEWVESESRRSAMDPERVKVLNRFAAEARARQQLEHQQASAKKAATKKDSDAKGGYNPLQQAQFSRYTPARRDRRRGG